MLGWIFRGFMFMAGLIASLFVARDALDFTIVQTAIALLLFVLLVAFLAFCSPRSWYARFRNRWKK